MTRAGLAMRASLLVLVVLATGCRREPEERVLRVLSWNTFNLPTLAGEMGQVNMDEKERGRLVARLMKESGYDVIALNEVFDETVRGALIEEAETGANAFRFVVEDLDGGGLEDSGLVLFSRLEPARFTAEKPVAGQHGKVFNLPGFAKPFPGTSEYQDTRRCAAMDVWWKGQPGNGEVDSWLDQPADNCLVAFHRYRACTDVTPDDSPFGSECEAGKGVGFVRLRQTNGRLLDVFWSHMQATLRAPEYELPLPDFLTSRAGQFDEMAAMINVWSPVAERDTVVMGDLNVNGDASKGFRDEYRKLLEAGGSVFGKMGFRDMWAESAPKDDVGFSWSRRNDHVPEETEEERLDYVMWRDQKGRVMCGQHPFVERKFDLVNAGGSRIDLSDHFGVGVELRQKLQDQPSGEDPCSPRTGKDLMSLSGTAHKVMKGRLAVPGACQWLRIEKGTWTVTSLVTEPLRITAWKAADISEQLPLFDGDEQLDFIEKQDEVQVDSEEPFYLKICWLDGRRTGDYELRVSPNVGADPKHPVGLTLNRPRDISFGNQFGANPGTVLWTRLKLPETFAHTKHALETDFLTQSGVLRVGTAPVGAAAPPVTYSGGFTSSWGVQAAGAFGGAADTDLFVVIEREMPANPAVGNSFSFRVTTDHQQVQLRTLECQEQEDATGDDRIRMNYTADGKTVKLLDLGDFDEGQDVDLSGQTKVGTKWVLGEVAITIFDQDGTDLDNDVTSGNALDNLGTIRIPALGGKPPANQQEKADIGWFTQDEARYRLDHVRRR